MRAVSLPVSPVARNRKDSTPRRAGRLLRCGISIRLTSVVGQERRIGAVRNISALPPRADVGGDIVEPPLRATRRHMQRSKEPRLFDHLVGAGEETGRQLEASTFKPERQRAAAPASPQSAG